MINWEALIRGYKPDHKGYHPLEEPPQQPSNPLPGAGYQPEIGKGKEEEKPPEEL